MRVGAIGNDDERDDMQPQTEQLVDRALSGDRSAVALLLVEHAAVVRGRIERRSPRPLLAAMTVDDLLQETFTRAIQSIATFRPVGPKAFENWLCTIADNVVRNAIRERMADKRGGGRMPARLHGSASGSFDGLAAAVMLDGPTASSMARHRETADHMQGWLDRLPASYREAIVLRYTQNLPLAQIATQLKTTEKAVEKLLQRGLEKLRELARESQVDPIASESIPED